MKVQDVNVPTLQDRLLDEGATLFYYRDIKPSDSEFKTAQLKGLRGEISDWNYKK